MRYFMYSPLDMSEQEAFNRAKPYLTDDHIVEVRGRHHWMYTIEKGERPKASIDTYLVRVEPDDSLRVVDRKFS